MNDRMKLILSDGVDVKRCRIQMHGSIDELMYTRFLQQISILKVIHSKIPSLTIAFSTYGGDIYYSLAIYDVIKGLEEEGITTEVVCSGPVMSGGIIVICAAHSVVATKNTRFMLHYGSEEEGGGNYLDVKNDVSHWNDLVKSMEEIIISKVNVTPRTVKSWLKKDTHLSASKALGFGLIDGVI